ncbi:unnamed protein product [Nyctereutes procyonoides]|uniref:(raccoon dog) hypothetical protein n=1 Tax=Nyctereutes procyonoides TaxID=34880 RepID=A0A811ZBD2_NYCPR|nr:unnamed protein product [Nyctereutes procyonoides]
MPVYHSCLMDLDTRLFGDMALLPIRNTETVDEAIFYFKANVFFKNYETPSSTGGPLCHTAIKGVGRIYAYVVLRKADIDLTKRAGELTEDEIPKSQGEKEIYTLGITNFPFLESLVFHLMRFMLNLQTKRKISKWWTCFVKRRFMNNSLSGPGQ